MIKMNFDHLLIGLTLVVYAIASYTDLRRRMIPNWLLAGYGTFSILLVGIFTKMGVIIAVITTLILSLLIGFTWGKWAYQSIGGGDIKLLMVSIIPFSVFPVFYTVTIFAFVLLGLLVVYGARRFKRSKEPVPLAPVLFIATTAATVLTYSAIGYI